MEKPILFNTEMVQAILQGRKTQTRRIIKPKYSDSIFELDHGILYECEPPAEPVRLPDGWTRHKVRLFKEVIPKYKVGDILWVRETWQRIDNSYFYKADNDPEDWGMSWRPSIHMPRKAARIFLKATDVRVQRVCDITEEEAIKEGCTSGYESTGDGKFEDVLEREWTAKEAFQELWDSCYQFPKNWCGNPWVWVIEFERLEG